MIAPAFAVAGVLLAAIPIVIHLLNRRRYKVLDWAAMQFLLAAMRKNRRRLRFEQWLLLATRCALLALLGLALARPMGCDASSLARLAGSSTALHVIVIDNSYSMAYEADRPSAKTNLDEAKKLAHAMVDKLSSGGDAVVLISAAQPAEAIIAKPTYDLAAAGVAIDRVAQKFTGTDLAGAFQLAQRTADEETNEPIKTLDVFSDSTASAWRNDTGGGNDKALEALGPKLAAAYHIRHFNLSAASEANAAVLDVWPATNLVRTNFASGFNADVRNFGGSAESSVIWTLGDEPLPGGAAVALDAQRKIVTQSNANLRTGGPTVIAAKLSAEDRLPVDNVRYHTLDVAAEMKVLIVEGRRGGEGLDGSGAFLNLALSPPPIAGSTSRNDSYIKAERISDIELAGRALGDYRAILLSDVAQITGPVADQLARYVKAGGTILWFMGEQVQRDNYNTVLAPRGLLPGPLAQRQSAGGQGGGFTFAFSPTGSNHPLLAAFKDIEKSGLETAQVFTYWQITPQPENKVETVLAFNASGQAAGAQSQAPSTDPAVTLQTVGDGRVVFFATSADAEWTNFPAKPAYVALLHEILAGTVAGGERWMNIDVDQPVIVPQSVQFTSPPSLLDPQTQTQTPLTQITRPDGSLVYASPPVQHPGVWRLVSGGSSIPISVNVPAGEADIRPVSDEAIRQSLGNAPVELLGTELPTEAESASEGNDFGWSVMSMVLVLLGFECFLAMRFGHFRK